MKSMNEYRIKRADQLTAEDLTPRELMQVLKRIPRWAEWTRREYEEVLFRKLGYEAGVLESDPEAIPAVYTLAELKMLVASRLSPKDLSEIHLTKIRLGGQRVVQEVAGGGGR